jgi:hypothetical protein
MVQKCLKEACTVANDVIICYSKGHITLRVLNAIKSISIVLRDNNIFAGDYVIEGIAALFDEASLLQREGEIAQIMDIILAKGYVYVMGSDIPLRLKLSIPVEEPKRIRNLL